MSVILAKEGYSKHRETYLKKLDKRLLIQVLLSIEFGNTMGFEPVEFKKKVKKENHKDSNLYGSAYGSHHNAHELP